VAPFGVALPAGAPPPETEQLPGDDSVGVLASLKVSGLESAVQAFGAPRVVLSMQLVIAGVPMVQVAPVGAEHWHAEHAR
jgi:hypothetical protein